MCGNHFCSILHPFQACNGFGIIIPEGGKTMPRKILKQDGNTTYVFNTAKFQSLYNSLRQMNKKRRVKDEIAEAVNVEADTVKNGCLGRMVRVI